MNPISKHKYSFFSSLTIFQRLTFSFFSLLLVLAVSHRIFHTYLEDDMMWLIPLVSQILNESPFLRALQLFHTGELNFTDGVYATFLMSISGLNFKIWAAFSLTLHFANTFLLYLLLRNRMSLQKNTCFFASLIYLVFAGHSHAYVWPLAAHHLAVVFFILLISNLYLKVVSLRETKQNSQNYYAGVLFICLLACWQRLSILIVPASIFTHILFTSRNKRDLLSKYDLWSPLFGIFFIYHMIVVVYGGQGGILNEVLAPFYSLVQKYQGAVAALITAGAVIIGIVLVRCILFILLRNAEHNPVRVFITKLSFINLFIPGILFLCLYSFIFPQASLQAIDLTNRWQQITFPSNPYVLGIGFVTTLAMLLAFLIYVNKKNNDLIIFVPWYCLLVPYLNNWIDSMPSKYLIYASPIFALIFSLFFFEILPSRWPSKLKSTYLKILSAAVCILLTFNVLSIKTKLHKTFLSDYHWSYDYIKAASLISQDLKGRPNSKDSASSSVVCISGIQDLPHKDTWQSFVLKNPVDTFRKIFLSTAPAQYKKITINTTCPEESLRYTFNGYTVQGPDGTIVEAFYNSFETALELFKDDQDAKASELLKTAVNEKPFLLKMLLGDSFWDRFFEQSILNETAAAVYDISARSYDGDLKINAIDTLIRKEAQDYGKAVMLLASLRDKKNDPGATDRLLKKAYLFISKTEFLHFIKALELSPEKRKPLHAFLDRHPDFWPYKDRPASSIKIERYNNINIFRQKDFYFGIPAGTGNLDLGKIKANEYKVSFVAKTRHAVRNWADSQDFKTARPIREEFYYKNFQIIHSGNMFYASPGDKPDRQPVFKARSLLEIKLAVDYLSKIEPGQDHSLERAFKKAVQNYLSEKQNNTLRFQINLMHIPFGYFEMSWDKKKDAANTAYYTSLMIRPPGFIKQLSGNRAGLDFTSSVDSETFLPYRSEQTDLNAKKHGKKPRTITYSHKTLSMFRKGNTEDIADDTRDYAGLILWLMSRDYTKTPFIKTTINVDRTIFLVTGIASENEVLNAEGQASKVTALKLIFVKLSKDYDVLNTLPMTLYLIKDGQWHIPILIDAQKGLFKTTLILRTLNQ